MSSLGFIDNGCSWFILRMSRATGRAYRLPVQPSLDRHELAMRSMLLRSIEDIQLQYRSNPPPLLVSSAMGRPVKSARSG